MYWIFFIWYKLDAILKTKMMFRIYYYVDSKRVRGIRISRKFREFYSFFISKNHCFHVWCASKVLWKSYSKNMCHFVYPSKHSHKKRIVCKHGRLNRNLYGMLKFTERFKTPGMTSKKTLLSLKGISSLLVIVC